MKDIEQIYRDGTISYHPGWWTEQLSSCSPTMSYCNDKVIIAKL